MFARKFFLIKNLRLAYALVVSIFAAGTAHAIAPSFIDRSPVVADLARLSLAPGGYQALSLNFASMEAELALATEKVPVQLSLPLPNGSSLNFDLVPVEIMAPQLAAQFPRARNWRGTVVNPINSTEVNMSVRIDTASGGFSAMFFGCDGVVIIESISMGAAADYIACDRVNIDRKSRDFIC